MKVVFSSKSSTITNNGKINDIIPEVQISVPAGKKPSQIPGIISPVLNYQNSRFVGRGYFRPSEYNLYELGRIEDTESYVMQAFSKKVALMFKEGWDLIGTNPKTVAYIRLRLSQISRATNIPTLQLFRSVGDGLIRKSNVFLVKVRNLDSSGGKPRVIDLGDGEKTSLDPVAGYFIAPAETMEFQIENGQITAWRQNIPGGIYRVFDVIDVFHFYYNRKEGFIFGTPTLTSVIDDIRAFRKIEENIELLIYQNLFPLFQYKIGTEDRPAGFTEDGRREVDVVKHEIQRMPSEGGLVTTERHEIKAIGAEGRALRAEGYLDHFKHRVMAGLGISAVDLGEGRTANRSTADTMSRNLIDSVKDYQQVMEFFINEFIINELLLESTFGDAVLDEENRVYIKFKEVDLDYQIKKEAHYADQFNKDMISQDEGRMKIGLEPIRMPSPDEIESEQDLSMKYPGWYKTRWKLFEEPKLLIQALDEPYSMAAKAAAMSRSTSTTMKGLDEHKGQMEAAKTAEQNHQVKVATMKKPTVKKKVKDAYVEHTFHALKNEIVERIKTTPENDYNWMHQIIRMGMATSVNRLQTDQFIEFNRGFSAHSSIQNDKYFEEIKIARTLFADRANKYVQRLTNDIIASMKRNMNPDSLVASTRAVFDTLSYRVQLIEETEAKKAYNYGKFIALKLNGATKIQFFAQDAVCKSCNNEVKDVSLLHFDSIPPFHPNCNCQIDKALDNIVTQDTAPDDPPEELHEKGLVEFCLNCGKTAMRVNDTPDVYKCRGCGYSFRKPVAGAQNNG